MCTGRLRTFVCSDVPINELAQRLGVEVSENGLEVEHACDRDVRDEIDEVYVTQPRVHGWWWSTPMPRDTLRCAARGVAARGWRMGVVALLHLSTEW